MDQPKPQPTKLYRSDTDRVFAGVAGGLAEYFNVDSTLVRLIFILFTLAGGAGIVLYIVLMLIMPRHSQAEDSAREAFKKNVEDFSNEVKTHAEKIHHDFGHRRRGGSLWVGAVFVVVGFIWLLQNLNLIGGFDLGRLWPVLVILAGLSILARS